MSHDAHFTPGRELSRAFYEEAVSPVVATAYPQLRYAAGLLGPGSDVLGYDTARSMDHDWGPRCLLILSVEDEQAIGSQLRDVLTESLPATFRTYPVMFQFAPDDPGVSIPAISESDAPIFHRVEIVSLPVFLARLGYEAGDEHDPAFWLTVPEQKLLEYTSGGVFRDDAGELTSIRDVLSVYPDDVWRYRMGAMWKRISQIEPFIGRTGEVGDHIGSFVIGARLVEDCMRLSLLQARHYAPYSKWLGTAFSRLEGAHDLHWRMEAVTSASSWQAREAAIVAITSTLLQAHNRLGVTPSIDPSPRSFHTRPFTVIDAERVSDAMTATLADSAISRLPAGLGGIDQFMDSTDALGNRWLRRSIWDAMKRAMQPDG